MAVSVGAVVCTILIHTVVVVAIVNLVRLEKRGGRMGRSLWFDIAIVGRAIALALVADLLEIAVRAVLFVMCGEFADFGTAYYHSAVNYTTLGYGDIVPVTPIARMVAALEAVAGVLYIAITVARLVSGYRGGK